MRNRKTRKLKNKLLIPFEWLAIGIAMGWVPWLSRKWLFAACDCISSVMYAFDRRGKRLALETLRIIRGTPENVVSPWNFDPDRARYDATRNERLVIRRSYRNMARSIGYAFWTICRARSRCAATGEVTASVREFLAANRPAVTVSGHLGCWEILSQLAFLEGHAMMSVAKDIGTRGMTRLLMRARRSIGQEIVPAEGAFKPLMAGIRAGKSLGLLVDQKVSARKGGVWIRFFNVPMPVSAAPAFFAAKTKVPIVVAWSRPLKDGRYRCEMIETISSGEARDVWRTTQRIANDLERIVRRHPSCWVLNYNYFRSKPKTADLQALAKREAEKERQEREM